MGTLIEVLMSAHMIVRGNIADDRPYWNRAQIDGFRPSSSCQLLFCGGSAPGSGGAEAAAAVRATTNGNSGCVSPVQMDGGADSASADNAHLMGG